MVSSFSAAAVFNQLCFQFCHIKKLAPPPFALTQLNVSVHCTVATCLSTHVTRAIITLVLFYTHIFICLDSILFICLLACFISYVSDFLCQKSIIISSLLLSKCLVISKVEFGSFSLDFVANAK